MAKKRIPECTRDASEADFNSDNFLLIDGVDGSAKLEMELVGKQSSINTIGNSLTAEIERATNEEASIRTAVTNETNRASSAEGNLNTAIVEETTRATGAESNLDSAITAEASRATGVESSLDSAITAEATRATGAEGDLSAAITAEATRAAGAEGDLSAAITAEATRAKGAEGGLNTAITTEVTRAKGAEGSLSTALGNEITRATGAEGDLSAAITAEYNRATGAESSLSSEIATKEPIISDLSNIRTGAGLGATALQSIVSATGPHYNTYSASGPTVTSTTDTSAKKTTLTFDYMKGPCGPKGDKGDTGLAAGFASAMGVTTNTGAAGSSASVTVTPDSTTPNTAKKFNFEFTIPKGDKGDKGNKGDKGDKGDTGNAGASAGFASSMGVTTNTGAAGSSASVTVTPDSTTPNTAKKFNFVFNIPRGDKGATGDKGDKGNKGDKGDTGSTGSAAGFASAMGVTTTTGAAGSSASVTVTPDSGTPNTAKKFNFGFTIPRGDTGSAAGFASAMGVTTTTGAAGSSASVTVTPDSSTPNTAKKFNFGFTIPKGDKGDTGNAAGFASSMGVTTTTGAAGSSASVTVTPDSSTPNTAKKFNFAFTIPRGEKGETGPTGPDGNIGIVETTNTSDITLRSNQRYKLSVGSKTKVFTTPSGVSSVTFNSSNQLRVVTDGSITSVTVPYAASAGSATTATSATEVYNKVGNAIIAAGTNGISITDGEYTSVLGANTLSVGTRNSANVGTIGCGTLNATTGIALLTSGGQVKANITSREAVFNVGVSTTGAFTATGDIKTTTGAIHASNGLVYAKTGLNTDAMVLARKGIMVVPENGTTKGFGVDIADDHNVFNVYGSTDISMNRGNLILEYGNIHLLNGGKVYGTATNAEGLNGYTVSIGSYVNSPNVLSFV